MGGGGARLGRGEWVTGVPLSWCFADSSVPTLPTLERGMRPASGGQCLGAQDPLTKD